MLRAAASFREFAGRPRQFRYPENINAGCQHLLTVSRAKCRSNCQHFRVLQKRLPANHGFKLIMIYKEIVLTAHFTRTRRARGM